MNTQASDTPAKLHFSEIDICRGIGILLVVLGHSLKQTGTDNSVFDLLIFLIYAFHMPLFFFLSGFVATKILDLTTQSSKLDYIKKRAVRLLIPYFFIGVLYMPLKYFLSRYSLKPYDFSSAWKLFLGDNPNTALWFLYILFIISCLCTLVLTRKNLRMLLAFSFILSLASYSFSLPSKTIRYLFFFILGIFVRTEYPVIRAALKKNATLLISILLYALSSFLLYRYHVSALYMLTSLAGTCACLSLSLLIADQKGAVQNCLSFLGEYSMDIYILSEPFNTVVKLLCWNILHMNYLACTILCFIAAALLPIPVSLFIVRRIRFLRLLVLGIK